MAKQEKRKTRWGDLRKGQKFLVIFLISITITVTILMSVRAYFFFKFLTGSDVLIKLDSDKQNIDLLNGQEEIITFDASVTANPSCLSKCNSEFIDVTNNISLDWAEFEIDSGTPIEKIYTIRAPEQGRGQILYIFKMECQGIKTYTCDTKERVTNRNILITLNYDLSELNKNKTDKLRAELNNISYQISKVSSDIIIINESLISNEISLVDLEEELETTKNRLENTRVLWNSQKYNSIVIPNTRALSEKHTAILDIISNQKKKEILANEFNVFVEYDALCQLASICYPANNIQALANNNDLDINESCNKIEIISELYNDLESENDQNYLAQNYNVTTEFSIDIKNKLTNLKNQIKKPYLENLQNNSVNYDILTQIIIINNTIPTNEYSYNLTPALIKELIDNLPTCTTRYNSIALNNTIRLPILFEDPSLICGYYKNYTNCCVTQECRNDPTKYPIIFLHGHDFSKDTPADYSLDTFRVVERKLAEKGYLTAGVISVSSSQEEYGRWGLTNIPLTLRGSYYFDVYKTQEDYQILQTKSENIDTYAVRLNDIINNVKFDTGRPKVIIIAHSMGGLVARRYAQIFGNESVDKLILIGTPNKGIEGTILKACPILGEDLECQDMDSTSLFMNKLNSQKPNVKIYNIIGTNCTTDGQLSDGIAFEKNVYLEEAENIYINGSCEGIKLLHNEMLNVAKYPDVMEAIYTALNLTNNSI